MKITPGGTSHQTNHKLPFAATTTNSKLASAGSEASIIEELKHGTNLALQSSIACMGGSPAGLAHSKSTGNLLTGGLRKIKEALR